MNAFLDVLKTWQVLFVVWLLDKTWLGNRYFPAISAKVPAGIWEGYLAFQDNERACIKIAASNPLDEGKFHTLEVINTDDDGWSVGFWEYGFPVILDGPWAIPSNAQQWADAHLAVMVCPYE